MIDWLDWFRGDDYDVDPDDLPEIVRTLTGTKDYGPNCWNATMLFHGVTTIVEWTSDTVITKWLKSETDEISGPEEVGDIMCIWEGGCIQHTAVYVGNGLVWQKYGCANEWEFKKISQVKKDYAYCLELVSWRRVRAAKQQAA